MRCDVRQPRLVHDPEHLDEHRVPVGLETAAEYDRSMRKTYGNQTSVGASGGQRVKFCAKAVPGEMGKGESVLKRRVGRKRV